MSRHQRLHRGDLSDKAVQKPARETTLDDERAAANPVAPAADARSRLQDEGRAQRQVGQCRLCRRAQEVDPVRRRLLVGQFGEWHRCGERIRRLLHMGSADVVFQSGGQDTIDLATGNCLATQIEGTHRLKTNDEPPALCVFSPSEAVFRTDRYPVSNAGPVVLGLAHPGSCGRCKTLRNQ